MDDDQREGVRFLPALGVLGKSSVHREYRHHRGQTKVELILRDDPDRVDDTGDVAKDRQQDVDPEVLSYPDLQEHTQGREKYRD